MVGKRGDGVYENNLALLTPSRRRSGRERNASVGVILWPVIVCKVCKIEEWSERPGCNGGGQRLGLSRGD